MLTALAALFSTTGIGAIIGALGGLANRWLDLKSKQMDLEDKKAERAHQLSILEKEIAIRERIDQGSTLWREMGSYWREELSKIDG